MSTGGVVEPEQLALLRSTVRASRSRPPKPRPEQAAELPVARVAVDVGLAHLDRPFDFLVPEPLSTAAQPGVRVRVRFAGRLVDGYVVERAAGSEHVGRLAFLEKVVSPEPVLAPEVLTLARQVADRYAGTLADVLRLAIPPRHARVESAAAGQPAQPAPEAPERPAPEGWARYEHGTALLDAVHAGATVRAVWSALPGPTWPDEIARLAAAALSGGRGALVVLPDHRDVDRVDAALTALLGAGQHVALTAEPGPAERYRRWLRVRRGEVRAVVGTRAAMFAPVRDLGLALVWDDGDDLHAEPRAPYPHVRAVLALRSTIEGAALVVGGLSRTAEGAGFVRSGWARSVAAPRDVVRRTAPAVVADTGDDLRDAGVRGARLPSLAWRTAHEALRWGPVLVQVPRAGYLPGLACGTCRAPARCPRLPRPARDDGLRRRPGLPVVRCPGGRLGLRVLRRAAPAGDGGRLPAYRGGARPGVPSGPGPRQSGRPARCSRPWGRSRHWWSPRPAPSRSPRAGTPRRCCWTAGPCSAVPTCGPPRRRCAGGQRPPPWSGRPPRAERSCCSPRARHRPCRPWSAGTRPASPTASWGSGRCSGCPPRRGWPSLTGAPEALAGFLAAADLPVPAEVLGPVPAGPDQERFLVRAPGGAWGPTVAALKAAAGVRSAHKEAGSVRVQVDPLEVA